jgi:hypothetical protein
MDPWLPQTPVLQTTLVAGNVEDFAAAAIRTLDPWSE